MKYIQSLVLMLAVAVPFVSNAVTIITPGESEPAANAVEVRFGLSGKITHYKPSKSMIVINGVRYNLSSKSGLADTDLKPEQKVSFNVEQSPDAMGSITRIWIENKR